MKTWLRWALIVSQVGGGFTGIAMTGDYLYNSEHMPPPVIVVSTIFIALYAFVTVAGVLYALNEQRTGPLRLGEQGGGNHHHRSAMIWWWWNLLT